MDLSLNRVENENWLVLVPMPAGEQIAIISVKQACLTVLKSRVAPVSPILYCEIIPFIHNIQ